MRTYKYEELDDKAKEKAKREYVRHEMNKNLYDFFKNSNLKVQYFLNYCQEDGLNIYGNVSFIDLLNNLKDNFSINEIEKLKECFKYENGYELEENKYCYCIIDKQNLVEHLIKNLKNNGFDYDKELLEKFNNISNDFLCEICSNFKEFVYNYLKSSDDDLKNDCERDGYEFLEDGNIYYKEV